MSKTDNTINTITVSTLLSLYANSLSSTMDGQFIVVEGFFSDNNNNLYGQYYYNEIVSKEKQHKITIQITHNLKSKLTRSAKSVTLQHRAINEILTVNSDIDPGHKTSDMDEAFYAEQ